MKIKTSIETGCGATRYKVEIFDDDQIVATGIRSANAGTSPMETAAEDAIENLRQLADRAEKELIATGILSSGKAH